MPCSTFPIDPNYGPVLEIGIALPLSAITPPAAGTPASPPSIRWIKAIADTGCSHTSIYTNVAGAIGLNVISKTSVHNTSQIVAANVYHADLFLRWTMGTFSLEFPFRDRQLMELIRSSPGHEALLGMDILGLGTFYVNGQSKTATFCW